MGGMGVPGGGMGLGIGGTILLLILSVIFGQDFLGVFSGGGGGGSAAPAVARDGGTRARQEEPMVQFVSFVLDDAQNTWRKILGPRYQDARLVLFRDYVQSACGNASAATGPFYCPADGKVYVDLAFFEELGRRFEAPGDFAQAYVLAHEIGHHVQNLLGVERKLRQAQRANPAAVNQLSVRMELQADCLAGIWAHSTAQRGILELGDVEEGLAAAAAVGDDRIQKMARGRVSPESFTHGSSAQRVSWFRKGLDTGDVGACDTFRQSSE
jgi:predicted metalloprotease